ncbi:MAG: CopG family transcriptional regulator [Nocardioidaceae bacterium]
MHRTQIYLDDEEADLLGRVAERTGASRSELIRRAIRTQYGAETAETRLAGLRASAGAWRGRSATGAEYVETVRADLNERFEQVGLG